MVYRSKDHLVLVLFLSGVYVCVEVDGYKFYDQQAKTHSSVRTLDPHWDQVRLISFLTEIIQNWWMYQTKS